MGFEAEDGGLEKLGLDYELLDSGCCGMAGSFGFEAEHYDVSVAVGERRLLPAVRDAAADTLVIADGFSCKTRSSSSPTAARSTSPRCCRWRSSTGPGAARAAARARLSRPRRREGVLSGGAVR